MCGHPTVGEILTELDHKILPSLIELDVQESTDPKEDWFSVTFVRYFIDNDWSKTYKTEFPIFTPKSALQFPMVLLPSLQPCQPYWSKLICLFHLQNCRQLFHENPYFENESLWKKFTRKLVEGEMQTIITTSGVKVKPEKEREVRKKETILKWFRDDDVDTELGEVIRNEIWAHPLVMDAYGDANQDEGDEADYDSTSKTPDPADEADYDLAMAIAASLHDSPSKLK